MIEFFGRFSSATGLDLTIFHTQRVSVESFGAQWTSLIADLSIARAQMVLDQIRQLVETRQIDQLVVLTTSEDRNRDSPLAAAVAVIHRGLDPNQISDIATVIHVGPLRDFNGYSKPSVIADLGAALDSHFCKQGIRFAQWATDVDDTDNWCPSLGYQQIASLEYLCGDVLGVPTDPCNHRAELSKSDQRIQPDSGLCFRSLSWGHPGGLPQFTKLVEATYVDTRDCPALSQFRTTEQVLNSYRTTAAYRADLWFTVVNQNGDEVGCAIFAIHPPADDVAQISGAGSVEIVYMGLIPQARGNKYGKQLVQKAFAIAQEIGANQVLLAVDTQNTPAKSIYIAAGLKTMVHERVWIKSIPAISTHP